MNDDAQLPRSEPIDLAAFVSYADASVVSKTLMKKDAGTVTLFSFDKDQGLSEHTAPFEALVQVLDGRAEITIGGEPRQVSAGEVLLMPANVPHALFAHEKFKMLLIMIRGG